MKSKCSVALAIVTFCRLCVREPIYLQGSVRELVDISWAYSLVAWGHKNGPIIALRTICRF